LGLEFVVSSRDLGGDIFLHVRRAERARHLGCQQGAGQLQDMAIAICQCPRSLNALLRSSRVIVGSAYRANVRSADGL
jgi:hypothetical protein